VSPRKPAKPLISKPKPAKAKSGVVTSAAAAGPPGLRERKRQQTRERLSRAAMALFLERGFEATTLDDIAAAADISRRSFFHYFASKEDVVFAWQEESTAALVAAVAARPADEPMLVAAENAITAMVRQLEPNEAIAMACLKRDNPALQARDQVKYEKLERAKASGPAGGDDRNRRHANRRRTVDRRRRTRKTGSAGEADVRSVTGHPGVIARNERLANP
jgi:AcrR family transcriptional regulator